MGEFEVFAGLNFLGGAVSLLLAVGDGQSDTDFG